MFIQLGRGHWNLEMLTSYRKNERTGEYLLMFPIGGGNIKVKVNDPQYPLVEEYLSRKTEASS